MLSGYHIISKDKGGDCIKYTIICIEVTNVIHLYTPGVCYMAAGVFVCILCISCAPAPLYHTLNQILPLLINGRQH